MSAPKAFAGPVSQRHVDEPAVLNPLELLPHHVPVVSWLLFEPLANGFAAAADARRVSAC
jgi:hypothetical protein